MCPRPSTIVLPGRCEALDFNAPLSNRRADAIVRALAASEPRTVLDVGCGWGELLLRLVAAAPGATGLGVDVDEEVLARGHASAVARGLADRVTFVAAPAPRAHEPADLVVCIGADHAYGSQDDALRALHGLVRPGGQLLFGSGFWERPPASDQAAAVGLEPDSLGDLADLVDLALGAGFRPLFVQTANRDEWERFESGFLAGPERWLQRHGDAPEAAAVRARADVHRNGWLRGYRNVLGFAYLTLGRAAR